MSGGYILLLLASHIRLHRQSGCTFILIMYALTAYKRYPSVPLISRELRIAIRDRNTGKLDG